MDDTKAVVVPSLELILTPEANDTLTVSFVGKGFTSSQAQHLAEHFNDAINSFCQCMGAVGTNKVFAKNMKTGEEVEIASRDFAPKARSTEDDFTRPPKTDSKYTVN